MNLVWVNRRGEGIDLANISLENILSGSPGSKWKILTQKSLSLRREVPPLANDAIEEWVEAVVGAGKNPPGVSISISSD